MKIAWGSLAALVAIFAVAGGSAAQASPKSQGLGLLPKCEGIATDWDTSGAEITRYPDGGSSYKYQVEEGSPETVTYGKPPQGFEPLKASAEELEDYAFPPRPDTDSGLKQWEEMVSKYKTTAPPIGCTGKVGPSLDPAEGEVEYSTLVASQNWSGYIANAPGQPHHYVMSQANYYQPYGNQHTSCKSNALEASWVGVGGSNTGALIQAGTSVNTSNGVGAFAVWTAGSSYHNANPALSFVPGNYMGMYASYELSTEHVYFYLENATTHELSPFRGEHIGTNYYDGTSAESITERPATHVGGELHLYPLLNYGHMTWWNSVVQTNANIVYNIGEVGPLQMEMTHNGVLKPPTSELLALPTELSLNKNYESYYYNCQ